MFAGMIARPRATSSRTNSGVISFGRLRAEVHARVLALQHLGKLLGTLVFADGDELHLGRDDAAPRVVHLRDVGSGACPARAAMQVETQFGQLGIGKALDAETRAGPTEVFGVAALGDPGGAQRLEARADIDLHCRVGVRARRVINGQRRIAFDLTRRAIKRRVRLRNLAHRHADVGARARDVDLARLRQWLDGGFIHLGGGGHELGIGVHAVLLERRERLEAPRFPPPV